MGPPHPAPTAMEHQYDGAPPSNASRTASRATRKPPSFLHCRIVRPVLALMRFPNLVLPRSFARSPSLRSSSTERPASVQSQISSSARSSRMLAPGAGQPARAKRDRSVEHEMPSTAASSACVLSRGTTSMAATTAAIADGEASLVVSSWTIIARTLRV